MRTMASLLPVSFGKVEEARHKAKNLKWVMSCLEISQAGKPERGTAEALSSVSVPKFSCTPENFLAFNRTVSCQNPHQQQPGEDNTTHHKTSLLSAGKTPLTRSFALTFPPPHFPKGETEAWADVGNLQWISLHVSAGA